MVAGVGGIVGAIWLVVVIRIGTELRIGTGLRIGIGNAAWDQAESSAPATGRAVLGTEPVLAIAWVPVVAVQQVGVGRPGVPVVDGRDHRSFDRGLPRLDERLFEITGRQARDHFPGVISLVAIALMLQKLCQQRGWRGWGGLRDPGTS